MTSLQDHLLPQEKVQYDFSYPLWQKILFAAALVATVALLYDDIRNARYFFVVVEVLMVAYAGNWLVQVLRSGDRYALTDQRVLRLGSRPAADMAITYPEISEVGIIKDLFGSRYIQVKTADRREIRLPMPARDGEAKAVQWMKTINELRGVEVEEKN